MRSLLIISSFMLLFFSWFDLKHQELRDQKCKDESVKASVFNVSQAAERKARLKQQKLEDTIKPREADWFNLRNKELRVQKTREDAVRINEFNAYQAAETEARLKQQKLEDEVKSQQPSWFDLKHQKVRVQKRKEETVSISKFNVSQATEIKARLQQQKLEDRLKPQQADWFDLKNKELRVQKTREEAVKINQFNAFQATKKQVIPPITNITKGNSADWFDLERKELRAQKTKEDKVRKGEFKAFGTTKRQTVPPIKNATEGTPDDWFGLKRKELRVQKTKEDDVRIGEFNAYQAAERKACLKQQKLEEAVKSQEADWFDLEKKELKAQKTRVCVCSVTDY